VARGWTAPDRRRHDVPETPRYPTGDTGDDTGARTAGSEEASGPRSRRSTYLVWAVGVALVVAVVVLHLSGVLGPGEH
jgi:hypothetical protein